MPLSKERVLRAAVDYADREGMEALSMRRLGQDLGVEAMSLYNHVRSKEELLNGMIDIVFSEIDLPPAEAAWSTATTPVMSPGFVRLHPRVISAVVQFNAWDATLAGARPAGHAVAAPADQLPRLAVCRALAGLADGNARRRALAGTRRARADRARVPDGERLAGLPAACSRRPAPRAVRPRRLRGGSRAGGGRDARAGDERRRRAGDRDPGAVLMPRRNAGAILRHQRGLPRTLPSWMDQAACAGHDDHERARS